MKITCLLFIYLTCFIFQLNAQVIGETRYSLIPYPGKINYTTGFFSVNSATTIIYSADLFKTEAQLLGKYLGNIICRTSNAYTKVQKNTILLLHDSTIAAIEGYKLNISTNNIVIAAKSATGIFLGIQTIRQLLPVEIENQSVRKVKSSHSEQITIPAVVIEDEPAYSWRGMHLDVARHFFSIAYLKKFINIMSLYKMNKLHLHLTDDQGWRIEIKTYPRLTEYGAWRSWNKLDSECMRFAKDNPDFVIDPKHIIYRKGKPLYGGFYTQDQIKKLVKFAKERHIDIIPEIDMPGHMMAAINAYPFLTCNGENSWGQLFTKPICPCNEKTFQFVQNIFSEIINLFPSTYIHIGGDEVDVSDWGKSTACDSLMKRESIQSLPALQSYFINRMESFFKSKGRKLIGWDEIVDGGVTPNALVMYWRNWVPEAPVKAVKNGNQVIMVPGFPLYFDYPADKNSLYDIYHFRVIPTALSAVESKSIIGAQANIWSEYIPSENRADYMYMPRMTALSELLWTNNLSHYNSFSTRLNGQFKRLDVLKVHYRLPDITGIVQKKVFITQDTLKIQSPLPDMQLRYTTDGSAPNPKSSLLSNPLIIKESKFIRIAGFTKTGLRGDVYDLYFQKQALALPIKINDAKPGLNCQYFNASFKNTAGLDSANKDSTFTVANISVPAFISNSSFGLKYEGYINIPSDGIYTFYLTCDDGGILRVAGRETVNNDGAHAVLEKNGQVALSKGLQPFKLNFFEAGGGYTLKLEYSKDNSTPMPIPSTWFSH